MAAKKDKKPVRFLKREAVVLTPELRAQVEDRVKETMALAHKLWGVTLTMPEIRYDLKSRVGGMANSGLNRLRFHAIYLVENVADYIKETVPHEVAHLLVPLVAAQLRAKWKAEGKALTIKPMSHGAEWQEVMTKLGRGPKEGQSWKDVIKHVYNPSSIELPARKKTGPRKPGGKKVGEILLKIKGLKPAELEALRARLGFEVTMNGEPPAPPTKEEIQATAEHYRLHQFLATKYPDERPPKTVSVAAWAQGVITTLEKQA